MTSFVKCLGCFHSYSDHYQCLDHCTFPGCKCLWFVHDDSKAAITYKWASMFALGKPNGFTYFNAYVGPSGVVGWVSRGKYDSKVYHVYWINSGAVIEVGTRGTAVHALEAVQGGVASSTPKVSIPLSQFTLRT